MSGYSPILELGYDPLTPREKVVFKQTCEHCQRMTTVDLTALASGSGDHAELIERVREVADDCLDAKDGGIILGGTVAREHGADLEALLAENAALRSDNAALREHRITADLLVSTLKADKEEVERKLAEAVGVVRLLFEAFPKTKPCESDESEPLAIRAARAFLSKEAERG